MTKMKVFIDFEAISYPFSKELQIDNNFPFAYSIGIFKGKKFKTKTTIINFKQISTDSVYEFIRKDISKKLRELTNNKNFKTNSDSVVFVGWSPFLEGKILNESFKGIELIDQANGDFVSLTKLTEKEFDDNYFENLRASSKQNLDDEFIIKRGLHLNGALAALAGYKLFSNTFNLKNGQYNINIDSRILLKEIRKYSKDDILRMAYLHDNPSIFEKRKQKLLIINKNKELINKEINRLNSTYRALMEFDHKQTILEALKYTNAKIKKLKKDKDNLFN
ncbi:MAG: hypothetical protein HRT99_03905 [Mycoplasmatales bacterium]|nr:hypothetical protein [Mycoplasmatales bacterium]